jgi:hypothetical protein
MFKKKRSDESEIMSDNAVIHKGAKRLAVLFAVMAWLLFLAGVVATIIPWLDITFSLSIEDGALGGLILAGCALVVSAVSCVISLLVTIARNSEDSIALLDSTLGSYNLE